MAECMGKIVVFSTTVTVHRYVLVQLLAKFVPSITKRFYEAEAKLQKTFNSDEHTQNYEKKEHFD